MMVHTAGTSHYFEYSNLLVGPPFYQVCSMDFRRHCRLQKRKHPTERESVSLNPAFQLIECLRLVWIYSHSCSCSDAFLEQLSAPRPFRSTIEQLRDSVGASCLFGDLESSEWELWPLRMWQLKVLGMKSEGETRENLAWFVESNSRDVGAIIPFTRCETRTSNYQFVSLFDNIYLVQTLIIRFDVMSHVLNK